MKLPEATAIDGLKASVSGQTFMTSLVFTVEGKDGLWRQVSREGRSGIKAPKDRIVAYYSEDKLIELVRWVDFENVLSIQAGLEVLPANAEGEPATV